MNVIRPDIHSIFSFANHSFLFETTPLLFMKYILLIFLICPGIISDVFAQKNQLVTRSGKTLRITSSFSDKAIDIASIKNPIPYKPDAKSKPRPVINADATLFYESFDNVPGYANNGDGTYNFPEGWLRFNVDGGTPHNSVSFMNNAWVRADDIATDSVAFSTSFNSPAGQADDWMWTPVIGNLVTGTNLKWVSKAYDPDYRDGYEVWIMRASDGPPTAGPHNIGNLITKATRVFSVDAESTVWTEHQVNLNDFVGDGIYIGFRNHSTDKYLLVIDDVLVETFYFDDLANQSPKPVSEYTAIPLNETRPLNFETQIANWGAGPAQVQLHVDINKGTESITGLVSSADIIEANSSKTFTLPAAYTPKSLGKHFFSFYHTALNPDPNPGNNITYKDSLFISRNTFSRVKGNEVTPIGIGAGPNRNSLLGITFTLNNTEKLRGILVGIIPEAGTKVRARIYTTTNGVPNSPFAPLWESDEITFIGTENLYTFFTGENPPTLAPGTYWFGCLEYDKTLRIFQHKNIFTPNTGFISWGDNPFGVYAWTAIENFGINLAKPLNINPVFECPEEVVVNTHISQEYVDAIATKTIVTDKAISNAKVMFEASKSITLNPGFSAEGNRFNAKITANVCPNIDF